jgi:hypothetical protein
MDTMQIQCTLRNVPSFLGVYPRDLLPSHTFTQPSTIIINTDPHTESGTHWLAIRLEPRSSTSYYFDSYGLPPFLPAIQSFLRHTCSVWDYNTTQLQSLTSNVCGLYCCLFVLYMDRGMTPRQFISLFNTRHADRQLRRLFHSEFGRIRGPRGGQCCRSAPGCI